MIKRFIACLSLLLLLTLLPLGGLRSQAAPGISPNIIDEADILNPERESSIAAEIARRYRFYYNEQGLGTSSGHSPNVRYHYQVVAQ